MSRAPESPPATNSENTALTAKSLSRAGGLVKLGSGHVAPVFAVALTFLYVDLTALLLVPFAAYRGSESFFGTNAWLAFAALSILSAIVFGLFSAVVSEQRGKTAWNFLAGHAGILVAPLVGQIGLVERDPRMALGLVVGAGILGAGIGLMALPNSKGDRAVPAAPVGPLLRRLCRGWHLIGNIWVGMALLATLMITLGRGIHWEDVYGTKSAQHVIYGGSWFGVVFLGFAASLIAATVRKYPWRVDQTGWIVVHIALVLLIVGAFMTFWGKVEGSLALMEGESSESFQLATDSELVVEEFKASGRANLWQPVWKSKIEGDKNPAETEPRETLKVEVAGESLFNIAIDRYYGTAEPAGSKISEESTETWPAVSLKIKAPGQKTANRATLVADGERDIMRLGGMLSLSFAETTSVRRVEALAGGRDFDLEQRGRLLAKDKSGRLLGALPIQLKRDGEQGAFRPLAGHQSLRLDGMPLTLQLDYWFDQPRTNAEGQPVDASPGIPFYPTAMASLTSDDGRREHRIAWAFEPIPEIEAFQGKIFPDIQLELDYVPKLPLSPGALHFLKLKDGSLYYAYGKSDGSRLSGDVQIGEPLPLGIPLTVIPEEFHPKYGREWEDYSWKSHHVGTTEALRITLSKEAIDEVPHHWLLINSEEGSRTKAFRVNDRQFRVRWRRPTEPLGFRLQLREFHRDYYPGSTQPSSYESYLYLRHPQKFQSDTGIKIDMNNPLRLDGWRLFQARFSVSPKSEQTVLQVNRDPGLGLTYFACALLTLGLVIVFFQKPFMRAWHRSLKAKGASATAMFLASLTVPVLAIAATLPGIALIVTTPESPLLGIAIPLIIAGLGAETAFVNTVLKRRFEGTGAAPKTVIARGDLA